MFTGIIEQTGTLVGLESRGGVRRITVEALQANQRARLFDDAGEHGSSVREAVVCGQLSVISFVA